MIAAGPWDQPAAWQDLRALHVSGRLLGSTGTAWAVLSRGNPAVTPEVTVTRGTFLVQALGSRGLQVPVCSSKGIRKAQPLPEIWGCRARGWHYSALCPQGHAALCSHRALVQVCTVSAPCQPTGHLSWLVPAACSSGSAALGAHCPQQHPTAPCWGCWPGLCPGTADLLRAMQRLEGVQDVNRNRYF